MECRPRPLQASYHLRCRNVAFDRYDAGISNVASDRNDVGMSNAAWDRYTPKYQFIDLVQVKQYLSPWHIIAKNCEFYHSRLQPPLPVFFMRVYSVRSFKFHGKQEVITRLLLKLGIIEPCTV